MLGVAHIGTHLHDAGSTRPCSTPKGVCGLAHGVFEFEGIESAVPEHAPRNRDITYTTCNNTHALNTHLKMCNCICIMPRHAVGGE